MPEDDSPSDVPPQDDFCLEKALIRSIFHLVHFIMALILSFALLVDIAIGVSNPFIFYLTPIIFLILLTDTPYFFCCSAPVFITSRLGIFNTLRGRGFIYQCSAALLWAHSYCAGILCGILGMAVWVFGILLFLLGVQAHDFGLEDWMEPVIHDTPESGNLLTSISMDNTFYRMKQISRYIIHIVHFLIVFLFLATVILIINYGSPGFYAPILYIIPLVIIILAIELFHLCQQTPPERLTSPLGALNSLWGRGIIYQAGAALVITSSRFSGCARFEVSPGDVGWRRNGFRDSRLNAAWILGMIAWGIGLVMFICGRLVLAFKLNDWVEKPKKQSIRLEDSDQEEAIVGLPPYDSE